MHKECQHCPDIYTERTEAVVLQKKNVVLIVAAPGPARDHVVTFLDNADDMEVLGPYALSVDGVTKLRNSHADVIIIDIGTPQSNHRDAGQSDPLVGVRRLLKIDSNAKIVMTSVPSASNWERSMDGLNNGAVEYLPLDFMENNSASQADYEAHFLAQIRVLARARRDDGTRHFDRKELVPTPPDQPASLRPFSAKKPTVIAIASSTGGPKALYKVISKLGQNFPIPILITQHMPATFTSVLAGNLSKRTNTRVTEGVDGELIDRGRIYLAPGDHHMTVQARGSQVHIKLDQNSPVNYCRPSADPMLKSIAQAYGSGACTVILTGMGSDGKTGCKNIVEAGGQVVVQDFESSTVWGMPRAVAEAGYASKILDINDIGLLLKTYQNP